MSGNQLAHDIGGFRLPLNFQLLITPANWPGPVKIGNLGAGFITKSIVIKVISAFDGSASLTIGDSSGHGNLVTIADAYLDIPATYNISCNKNYTSPTQINVYFNGSPTVGQLEIQLYYQ